MLQGRDRGLRFTWSLNEDRGIELKLQVLMKFCGLKEMFDMIAGFYWGLY